MHPLVIVAIAVGSAAVVGVGGFLGFRLAGKKNSLGTPESEAPEAPEKPEENPDNSSEEE